MTYIVLKVLLNLCQPTDLVYTIQYDTMDYYIN